MFDRNANKRRMTEAELDNFDPMKEISEGNDSFSF